MIIVSLLSLMGSAALATDQSPDEVADTVIRAATTYGKVPPQLLESACVSPDVRLRTIAFRAMGDIPIAPAQMQTLVLAGLDDREGVVRYCAADAASALPKTLAEPALPRLRELLADFNAAPSARHTLRALGQWHDLPLPELAAHVRQVLGAAVGNPVELDVNVLALPSTGFSAKSLDEVRANVNDCRAMFADLVHGGNPWSPQLLVLAKDDAEVARMHAAFVAAPSAERMYFTDENRIAPITVRGLPGTLGLCCLRTLVGDDDRIASSDHALVPDWILAGMTHLALNIRAALHGRTLSGDLAQDEMLAWLHRDGLSAVDAPDIAQYLQIPADARPSLSLMFSAPLMDEMQSWNPAGLLARAVVRDLFSHHQLAQVVDALHARTQLWHSNIGLNEDMKSHQVSIIEKTLGITIDQLQDRVFKDVIAKGPSPHAAQGPAAGQPQAAGAGATAPRSTTGASVSPGS